MRFTSAMASRHLLLLAAALTLLIIYYIFTLTKSAGPPTYVNTEDRSKHYSRWPALSLQQEYSQEQYASCFSADVRYEVEDLLVRQLSHLPLATQPVCRRLLELIQSVYHVSSRQAGPLLLPDSFAVRVKQWLGGDEGLLRQLHRQRVVHVSQLLTGEHVVYNPVRSHRPMPVGSQGSDWLDKLARDSQPTCDFCSVYNSTASDGLLRHNTSASVRVSNTFKMERWHDMVVTRPPLHHPTNLSRALYTAFVADAVTLAEDMMATESGLCFPHLAWDTLPAAGASQIHPHIHVLVAPDAYYGYTELWRESGEMHYRKTGRNLYNSLLEIHHALDLTVTHGSAVALAMLSGKGDLEVMVLGEKPNADMYELLHFATEAYHRTYSQFCYSLVMSWHSSSSGGGQPCAGEGALPAVARLIARGDCTSVRTDYSSFEIFQAVYRNHEPWSVVRALREVVPRHHSNVTS